MLSLPRRFTRRSILLSAVTAACAAFSTPTPLCADTAATWSFGANSFWSNAADWSTNPVVPNNSGGTLFDVQIGSGAVALDISPEIQLFTFNGGTLNGPGTLTVDGLTTWSTGVVGGGLLANGGISISGANAYIAGGIVTNAATTTLNGSTLHFQLNGASPSVFINNGSLNATGTAGNILNDSGTANVFINNGVLASSISGTFNIGVNFSFINNGTLSVNAGTTTFAGNETGSTGTYIIAAGANLNFNAGNHTFLPASFFSGAGNVLLSTTGTTTLSGSNYNISGTTTLINGFLNSSNPATISGLFVFGSNGEILGNITANGGISIPTANAYIGGGTLTNPAGQIATLSQSSLRFIINGTRAGVFINNGTFNATGTAGNIFNDSGTNNSFINNGVINSSISGTFLIDSVLSFINNGTLNVNAGITTINGNEVNSSGSYFVGTNSTLTLGIPGSHSYLPAAIFSGPGNVLLSTTGTTTLSGSNYNISGTTTLINGFLNSSNPATISGLFVFGSNGEILGNITANGGISIPTANAYIGGGTLTNPAGQIATLSQSSLRFIINGTRAGVFINNGTFNATGTAGNIFNDSGTNNSFINNGVINSSISGTFLIDSVLSFINNGTLNVNAGITTINGNEVNSSGSYFVGTNSTLTLGIPGSHSYLPAAIFSGPGNVLLSTTGTTTLSGSNYNISGTTTLINGFLNSSNPATISGLFVFGSNGEILGNITANGGISIPTANAYIGGGTLTNPAGQIATLSQSSLRFIINGTRAGVFINNGTFNATGTAGNIFNDSGTNNSFINNGVINSSISGTFLIDSVLSFINNGTLNVNAGITTINGNEVNSSGSYFVGTNSTLTLGIPGSHSYLPAAIFSGPGNVLLSTTGTTTLSGSNYNISGTTTLINGFLNSSNPATISGLFVFGSNGEILGNITANGGISIPTANAYIGGGTLTNPAGQIATLSQSSLRFIINGTRAGVFINNGTFNATGTAGNIFNDSGTNNSFINNGLVASTISGTFLFDSQLTFNNAGTLSTTAGTVTIASGGTHTGAFIQNGGKILFNGGTNNFNAGASILSLNVSSTARVVFNAGTAVTPGGSMTLTGGTTVLASGPNLPTKLTSLTITNNNALLDVTTSKLIVEATGSTDKATRLTSFNTSMSVGAITSSTAAADSNHLGVGLFDNAILNLTTFGGTTSVDANSILIAVAHLGDANRDGVVDIQDQSIVTNNWQQPRNNWAAGDLNHDGFVDIQDLTIVTNNWQQTSSFSQTVSQLDAGISPNSIVASVPEPSSLLLLAASALLLPARFRKRKNHPPA